MRLFKYPDGMTPNLAAIAYTFAGHGVGLLAVASSSPTANLAGVLLLAHTLMISAYLLHECIHETLFTGHDGHRRLGTALCWMNGGCYAGFEELRKKHLHHHTDRMDPSNWAIVEGLRTGDPTLWRLTMALERLHLPAIEVWLRVYTVVRPFQEAQWRSHRGAVVFAVAVRLAAFGALLAWSQRAALLYAVAGVLAIVALRVLDAFHHTFELVELPDYDTPYSIPPAHDRAYEQTNTFSNLISERYPLLNVLLLNFVYHNAHHAKPGVPWHRLPALEAKLYGDDGRHRQSLAQGLVDFHRYRVTRLLDAPPPAGAPANLGAVAVSLLTP